MNELSASISPAPAFYTTPELAERWRLSERQVFRIIASGCLQVTKFGRTLRIPAASVAAYEASLTT